MRSIPVSLINHFTAKSPSRKDAENDLAKTWELWQVLTLAICTVLLKFNPLADCPSFLGGSASLRLGGEMIDNGDWY